MQEHPLTRAPCFMLHPCQTALRMQLLMQQQQEQQQEEGEGGTADSEQGRRLQQQQQLLCAYARGWLSLVAPLLGLHMLA
jgi:hypothetical protein